jgi:hypothetical protein
MQTIECSPGYAETRFDMSHPIDTEDKKVEHPVSLASTSFILNEGEGLSTLSLSKGRTVVCSSGYPTGLQGDPSASSSTSLRDSEPSRIVSTMSLSKGRTAGGDARQSARLAIYPSQMHFGTVKKTQNKVQ